MSHLVCAECEGEGKLVCKGCLLVVYCSANCQRKHWSAHKQDCGSPLVKDSWKSSWQAEGRDPHYIGDGRPLLSFGAKKYLWGNVAAYDAKTATSHGWSLWDV
ncbi:hypothetical protein LTR09_011784 [Extremus antarcticus]|uniref:MYND-type domain-containing protein n=1 Tax=Extremus antarcticus TaxID=702011 RepID=A0AAJ0D5N6_9PEZI|nr:hypothetical protein LTR09_011784 [Extremus antarcticus]